MQKFVVIQLDGLSHKKLLEAVHTGHAPNLSSLMKEGHSLHQYNCGLPSNTPFAQAGIMYGKNDCIPGFTFIDKKLKKELKIRNPLNVMLMEELYFKGRRGILTDGGSYVNIFSGGAMKTGLTTSQVFNTRSKRFLKQFDILLLFFNPKIAGRIFFYGLMNFFTFLEYIYENLYSLTTKFKVATDFKYNITRLFSSVVFEELETSSLIREMRRGTPYLYITFNGYDENSHHKGPSSPQAFDAIQTIDRKIGTIMKRKGDYDIYILSDHGHTEAVPWSQLYGIPFSRFIHKTLGRYKHERQPHFFQRVQKRLDAVEGVLMEPVVQAEKGFHRLMARAFRSHFRQAHWNSHPYFLEVSDDLAHLYFNFTDERVHAKEIDVRYPGLLDTLKAHPGIGMAVVKDGKGARVLSKYGEVRIGDAPSEHRYFGEHFLKNYGDEQTIIRQIAYLADMHNAGDIILFGDYSKHNVISFINHYGSHGSAGGEQMHPFFLSPYKHDLSQTTNVKDLYDVFIKYHS